MGEETIVNEQPSGVYTEKRAYPRTDVSIPVQLQIEVEPKDAEPLRGSTVNMSRGGMLVRLDRRLGLRTRCLIRFLEAGDRVSPETTVGIVVRETEARDDLAVAFQFETPLAVLKVHRELEDDFAD